MPERARAFEAGPNASVAAPAVFILDGSVGRPLAAWPLHIAAPVAERMPTPRDVVTPTLGGETTALGATAAPHLSRSGRGSRHPRRVGDGPIGPPNANPVA